jgi:hypothetical protein
MASLSDPASNDAIRRMELYNLRGVQKVDDALPTVPYVEWQRANGETVREPNEPVTSLPFDARAGVDPERQQQLDATADSLVQSHNHDGFNFHDFGDMLETIAKRNDFTEKEKVNVWDKIVSEVHDTNAKWNGDGANPFTLNINRTWRNAHELLAFDDRYHSQFVLGSDKDNNSTLTWHNLGSSYEDFLWRVGPSAHSDITNEIASRYQIQCDRDFLQHGFKAYADKWNAYFVSPLPQSRNDEYLKQIKANTKEFGLPVADRKKIFELQRQYFDESKHSATATNSVPDPVTLTE